MVLAVGGFAKRDLTLQLARSYKWHFLNDDFELIRIKFLERHVRAGRFNITDLRGVSSSETLLGKEIGAIARK